MKYAIIFCLVAVNIVSAQPSANKEVFEELLSESVNQMLNEIPAESDSVYFNYSSPEKLTGIRSDLIRNLKATGKQFFFGTSDEKWNINYNVKRAEVKFGELYRDSFWSGYLTERTIVLSGSYEITEGNKIISAEEFFLTKTDKVDYDSINMAKEGSYPYPAGNNPEEPFFGSLIEPVIAVGITVITVYLFFNVRSK